LSLVWEGEGRALYSRGVNRIQAQACAGDVEWLATNHGIKRLDRKSGRVEHTTRLDGLPGDQVVAIAAGAQSVWCAVVMERDGQRFWALCLWAPERERWMSVHEIAMPDTDA